MEAKMMRNAEMKLELVKNIIKHGRRPGAEFGGTKIFLRPNFRKNFHFHGKNF